MDPQAVMTVIVAEIESFSEVPDWQIDTPNQYVRQFYGTGVPYRPCVWFGALSAAQRMHVSRITRLLEWNGSLVRVTEQKRDRVSHVTPTPRGLVTTVDASDGQANPMAIVSGLSRTLWGPPLIRQFLRLLNGPAAASGKRRGPLPEMQISWHLAMPKSL